MKLRNYIHNRWYNKVYTCFLKTWIQNIKISFVQWPIITLLWQVHNVPVHYPELN